MTFISSSTHGFLWLEINTTPVKRASIRLKAVAGLGAIKSPGHSKRGPGYPNCAACEGMGTSKRKGIIMLRWALVFLVVALIAGVFGFTGIAGDAAYIAKILFFIFLVIFVVGLIYSLISGKKLPAP